MPELEPETKGPRKRALLFERTGVDDARHHLVRAHAVWIEFSQWRKSAACYASAIECWGHACKLAGVRHWPPDERAVDWMCTLCGNAQTLQDYLSHLRSALCLVRAEFGAANECTGLVKGAQKIADPASRRYKARASPQQACSLAPVASVARTPVVRRADARVGDLGEERRREARCRRLFLGLSTILYAIRVRGAQTSGEHQLSP